jgi:hypothetical protein
MTWSDQPAPTPAPAFDPAPPGSTFSPSTPPAPRAAERWATSGLRRNIATAVLAAGLLVVGGAAVVFAADPSPSSAPSTTQPSGSGSTQNGSSGSGSGSGQPAAPNGGTHQPGQGHAANGKNCPNMGGSGSGSGGSAPSSPTAPSSSANPST